MGLEKNQMIEAEEARYNAAKQRGCRCVYCHGVIPFGEEVAGHSDVCGHCHNTVTKED